MSKLKRVWGYVVIFGDHKIVCYGNLEIGPKSLDFLSIRQMRVICLARYIAAWICIICIIIWKNVESELNFDENKRSNSMSESITRDLRGYVVTFGDNKIVCYGVLQVRLLDGHHYLPTSSSSLSVSSWSMQMSVKESMTMSTRMFFSSNRSKIQQWIKSVLQISGQLDEWMNVPWGQTLIHIIMWRRICQTCFT